MYGTANSVIPNAGKVEMAWVQMPLAPVNLSKAPPISSNQGQGQGQGNDDMMDMSMQNSAQSQSQSGGGGQGSERQQDLDYDVGDDDWGIS